MSRKKIPKIQIIVAGLIAGAIGTYAVINSLAATPPKILYVDSNGAVCSDSRTADQATQSTPLCSISKAMDLAVGGETINVAPGKYGFIRHIRQFPQPVTIHGAGSTKPIIMGSDAVNNGEAVTIAGGSNLIIDNMSIQGGRIMIVDHPTKKSAQVAQNITVSNDEFTNSAIGITIRSGARNVIVQDSYFHDLMTGISGPNYRIIGGVTNDLPNVDEVVIQRNRFEDFKVDALQFADWDNVTIDRNVMQHSHHDPPPAEQYHNDLIQFTGFSKHVIITNNYLNDATQEIFIQPAFGPISDVLVENNVLYNAGGYAIQSQGIPGARFINNVVWKSKYGGLLLRAYGEQPPVTDTIVANNILSGYGGTPAAYEDYNLILGTNPKLTYGSHDILGVDPKFVNPDADDFHLQPDSPAINAGTTKYLPGVDKDGKGRVGAPDMGAYEFNGGTPPSNPPSSGKRGDVTGPNGTPDGVIDIRDMSYLVRSYNGGDSRADLSGPSGTPDGKVDIFDLSYIIRNYGR